MKKKLLTLTLGVCMLASLAACSSDDKKEKTSADITLGQYKGIEVSEAAATVTDEELQERIDYLLKANQTTENVEEGTTKENDVILAVYTATQDGETVSALSGSSSGSNITLSDSGFAIDGFVDELIGKTVGETVEFDITIQDDFTLEDYSGETVHYSVEIKAIVVTTTPELTDEWAKETHGYLGINNVLELREYYRDLMRVSAIYEEIREKLLEGQTVNSYDSEELAEVTEVYKQQFEQQISYYGIPLDAYLQAMELSEEDFTKQNEEEAKEYLKEKMFIEKVAEAENITISDEEYSKKMLEYAKEMKLESESELVSYYEGVLDEDGFRYSMLYEKVQKFICDNVTVVPGEDGTETETETEEE